jgi:hypothetical protein
MWFWNTFLIWKTKSKIETIAKTKWDFNIAFQFQILRCKIHGKFWAAYDVPFILAFLKQLKMLFEKEDMKLVKVLPMKFDSLCELTGKIQNW